MDNTELTNYVATQSGLSKKEAALAVKTTLEGIAGSLKRGENVALHGFGNFQVKTRPARKGRNPATGQTIQIPSKCYVRFSPSSDVKQDVGKLTDAGISKTAGTLFCSLSS